MKKKILKNVAILTFALFGLGIIGNNVMYAKDSLIEDPGDGGGGGEDCNLCVVTNVWGNVIFSCRPKQGVNNCEDSGGGYTVSCENAEEC